MVEKDLPDIYAGGCAWHKLLMSSWTKVGSKVTVEYYVGCNEFLIHDIITGFEPVPKIRSDVTDAEGFNPFRYEDHDSRP